MGGRAELFGLWSAEGRIAGAGSLGGLKRRAEYCALFPNVTDDDSLFSGQHRGDKVPACPRRLLTQ
jgi:hypothetical protein